MGVANIMSNRKYFKKEVLDSNNGEVIEIGSVDGDAMICDTYEATTAIDAKRKIRTYRMTLFPTNRRIVVYQARSWVHRDRFAQLPYDSIDRIIFDCEFPDAKQRKKGRLLVCVTTFVSPDESRYPTIMFRYDVRDLYAFNAYRRVILPYICRLARVKLDDYSDYGKLQELGINQELLANSEKIKLPTVEQAKSADTASDPSNDRGKHSSVTKHPSRTKKPANMSASSENRSQTSVTEEPRRRAPRRNPSQRAENAQHAQRSESAPRRTGSPASQKQTPHRAPRRNGALAHPMRGQSPQNRDAQTGANATANNGRDGGRKPARRSRR